MRCKMGTLAGNGLRGYILCNFEVTMGPFWPCKFVFSNLGSDILDCGRISWKTEVSIYWFERKSWQAGLYDFGLGKIS